MVYECQMDYKDNSPKMGRDGVLLNGLVYEIW